MKKKQPSFLRQAWEVFYERQQTRKALRLLSKQIWSVEFLTHMLIKAANVTHQPLEMSISNGQNTIHVKTAEAPSSQMLRDDSIFNHLDDEVKVRQFIAEVNR